MTTRRQERAENAFQRAVLRYKTDAQLKKTDGTTLDITIYKSSPRFIETDDIGRRVVSSYEWLVTRTTFNAMVNFCGNNALFNGEQIIADGETYLIDRLTPYTALKLDCSYRILTTKIGITNESGTTS